MSRLSKKEAKRREMRAVLHVLQAPSLAPLCVVAGDLGLDGAVEVCRTRELTGRLASVFATAGWTLDHLPSAEEAELVILGARLAWRLKRTKRRRKPLPLQTLCKDVCDFDTALEAIKALDRHGASIKPVHRELKAP